MIDLYGKEPSMTRLSLIVPCYNCADTLEDAISSIYRQEIDIPFEVTMVDDGSTDGTYAEMGRLAAQYSNIRLLKHASNLGGGAARNTAVAHSSGELIFCLDADDMLGDGFLKNMIGFWQRKRCAGLGMSTSIKFRGSNTKDVAYVSNFERPGKPVRFESFLDGSQCSLSVVFLMTRSTFNRVGGYPTEHGFDTQGMGFRFLCNGLTAYTCPDTVYLHRVEFHPSYYLREQGADRLNWNWLALLEEFLYIFRREIKFRILSSDLFAVPGRAAPPALRTIISGHRNIYAPDYRQLIRLGRDGVARRLRGSGDKYDQYWLGSYFLSKKKYGSAIDRFKRALSLGFDHRILYYRLLEASLRLGGSQLSPSSAMNELISYSQPFPMAQRSIRHQLLHWAVENKLFGGAARWLNARWIRFRDRHSRKGA